MIKSIGETATDYHDHIRAHTEAAHEGRTGEVPMRTKGCFVRHANNGIDPVVASALLAGFSRPGQRNAGR